MAAGGHLNWIFCMTHSLYPRARWLCCHLGNGYDIGSVWFTGFWVLFAMSMRQPIWIWFKSGECKHMLNCLLGVKIAPALLGIRDKFRSPYACLLLAFDLLPVCRLNSGPEWRVRGSRRQIRQTKSSTSTNYDCACVVSLEYFALFTTVPVCLQLKIIRKTKEFALFSQ